MKSLMKISPLVISISCLSQTVKQKPNPKIEFGFTTSTFCGTSAANPVVKKIQGSRLMKREPDQAELPSSNYGWKQGLFYWVNLNSYLSYKAELDFVFSVNSYASAGEKVCYSTAGGYELKPQLIIKPSEVDKAPILKIAKNMSYYLSGKQPYLIVGPKFGFYKSDKAFRKDNNSTYYTIGCVGGFGIDNMFHNMDFAPELTVSVEYQTGNSHLLPKASSRYFISAAIAINFF
jgi:hypothetical protein